jgi:hypothetical protein
MATSSFLVPVQTATLIKLIKGGNNRKAIKVILLFLLFNIICIAGWLADRMMHKDTAHF